jgi:hypothetical protein
MMSYAASAVWSHPILLHCCTKYGQRCGVALSGCITTVTISKSGQLGRRYIVAACLHVLRAMMAQVSDILVTCEHALETCEPTCIGRSAKPFFTLEVCGPHRVVGHVAVPEPSRVGRRCPVPWDIWQRWSPPEQGGRIQSHGTRGNARPS